MAEPGRLILLPVPLAPDQAPAHVLPASTLAHFASLEHFIVENAKAARAFLKPLIGERSLQSLELTEWNEHRRHGRTDEPLAPLRAGHDVGLLSDAGCPAVADPGADLVAAAHAMGARVVPAVGPSALLLALMASGMGGQRFAFVGYLPADSAGREAALRSLEQRSARDDETILFIETPYRNQALLDAALQALAPTTALLVAAALSLPAERIVSKPVSQWRAAHQPVALDRRLPAVFGLKAAAATGRGPDSAQRGRGRDRPDPLQRGRNRRT